MADRLSKCILAGVFVLGIGALWASKADAQNRPPCGPTAELIAKLKADYNETEVGGGIVNEQAVVIAFSSPEGETWTLVQVNANGVACMMAAGKNWFVGALPKAGDDV